ncbi:rhodanese-like domain-containing protein [Shewanella sp. UCD-KL12]|uniref:rhodanese-like domain-containing protein n=1 Tax=Shewanella sp. UCD-KL12 TaxID=1917163 RepID=UPI000970FA14|nr:rhodanese-like domain-containing protein [Shewanella sp. UCD-KL12]
MLKTFSRATCLSLLLVLPLAASSIFCLQVLAAEDAAFPLREKYHDVPTISHQALYRELTSTIVVDVRSKYEFDTLHIADAVNISISNAGFITRLMKIRER